MRSVTLFPRNTNYPAATQLAIDWLLESNNNPGSYEISQENPHALNVFSKLQQAIEHRQKLVILHYLQFITTTQYLRNVLNKALTTERDNVLNDFYKNIYSQYSSAQKATISRYFECANTYHKALEDFRSLTLIFDRHMESTYEEWQPLLNFRNQLLVLKHEAHIAIKLEVTSIAELNSLIIRIVEFLDGIIATPNADEHHANNIENITTLRAQHTFDVVEYEANFRQLSAVLEQNYRISLYPLNSPIIEETTKRHARVLTETASKYSLQIQYLREFNEIFEPDEAFVWDVEQSQHIAFDNIAFEAFYRISNQIFPLMQDNANNGDMIANVNHQQIGVINKLREILRDQNVNDRNGLLKKANDDNFSILNPKNLKLRLSQFLHDIGDEENNFIQTAMSFHEETNHRFDFDVSVKIAKYWKELVRRFIQSHEMSKFESVGRIKNLFIKVAIDANELYEKLYPQINIEPEQHDHNPNPVIARTQQQLSFLGVSESYLAEVEVAQGMVSEANVVRDVTTDLLNIYFSGVLPPQQKRQLGLKVGKALELCGNNAVSFNTTQLHAIITYGHRESSWAILHAELKRLQANTHLEKLMASALYEYVSCTDYLLNSQSLKIWDRIHKYFVDQDIKFERSKVVSTLIGLIKLNAGTINDTKLLDELKRVIGENWGSKESSNSNLFKKLRSIVENNNMTFMFSPRQHHNVSEHTANELNQMNQRFDQQAQEFAEENRMRDQKTREQKEEINALRQDYTKNMEELRNSILAIQRR
jgi:hypothetical protein